MCEGGAVDDLQANQMRAEPEVLSRERAVWRVGGGASLGGGARSSSGRRPRTTSGPRRCNLLAPARSSSESRARRDRGLVPQPGRSRAAMDLYGFTDNENVLEND